jgi:hypothetical protein
LVVEFIKDIDKGIRKLNSTFVFVDEKSIEIVDEKIHSYDREKDQSQKRKSDDLGILKEDIN